MPPLAGLRKTGARARDFLGEILTQETTACLAIGGGDGKPFPYGIRGSVTMIEGERKEDRG